MLITISQTTISPTQTYDGDTPSFRGWYSRAFTAGDGVTPVMPGNGAAGTGFYYDIPCSVNGDGEIVIPEFTIQATEDGNLPTALFTGQLFQESGAPGQIVFGNPNGAPSGNGWRIPTLLGANVTWAQLFVYNQTVNLLNAPESYADTEEVMLLIQQFAGQFDYARVGHNGIISTYDPPDVASLPIAVNPNSYARTNRVGVGMSSVDRSPASDTTFVEVTDPILDVLDPATTSTLGVVKISTAALDLDNPKVYGTNDQRQPTTSDPVLWVSQFTSFNAAVTAANALVNCTLIVSQNQTLVTACTVNAGVTLQFEGAGALNIVDANTVTINSDTSNWPDRQIFGGGGVVRFTANKSTLEYLASWWAGSFGTSDDTPTLDKIVAAVPDRSNVRFTAGQYITLGSTWTISDRNSLRFITELSVLNSSDGSNAPTIKWGGSSSNKMIFLDRCRFCEISGFLIIPSASGTNSNLAIDIDGYSSGHISTSNQISSNYIYNFVNNASFTAIRISETVTNNNEFMSVIGNYIVCSNQAPGVGVGIKLGTSTNAHGHVFAGNKITNAGKGVWAEGGSFTIQNDDSGQAVSSFTSNTVDLYIEDQGMPIVVNGATTEGANQFAYINGSNEPVTIQNCRVACFGTLTKGIIEFGSSARYVNISHNQFEPPLLGVYDLATAQTGLTLTLENNRYRDMPAFVNYPAAGIRLVSINDVTTDNTGQISGVFQRSGGVLALNHFESFVGLGVDATVRTPSSNILSIYYPITHVGAGLIKTITPQLALGTFASGAVYLIPDAAFTTDLTGNIGKASTAVIGQVMTMVFDGSLWWPSY